jgi:HlyD family secretion protein
MMTETQETAMKRTLKYSTAIVLAAGLSATFFLVSKGRTSQPGAVAKADAEPTSVVAAPGRVEPISEEIKISSEIRGKIKSVLVEEGDAIRQGQVLAVLINDDYQAAVASAAAQLQQKEAELRRIINGARNQERREAWQGVKEAEAMLENARAELARRHTLFERGVIAREEIDRAEREFKVAQARFDAASERHSLVDDAAREEDRGKAEADVALARAQLDEAKARLEKTFIRSPINGIVLRKHLKNGESVSDMREMPIVTIADVATLRVRVDVDETDVSKIQTGQRAYVKADAYGDKRFWGRVIRIGQVLGKKNVRTDEPSERIDTKILETLVELDAGERLPAGLRVDSFILTDKPAATQAQ